MDERTEEVIIVLLFFFDTVQYDIKDFVCLFVFYTVPPGTTRAAGVVQVPYCSTVLLCVFCSPVFSFLSSRFDVKSAGGGGHHSSWLAFCSRFYPATVGSIM